MKRPKPNRPKKTKRRQREPRLMLPDGSYGTFEEWKRIEIARIIDNGD